MGRFLGLFRERLRERLHIFFFAGTTIYSFTLHYIKKIEIVVFLFILRVDDVRVGYVRHNVSIEVEQLKRRPK